MKAKVQKWGNSLALRIPKAFATEVGVVEDSEVEVSVVEGELVVTPTGRAEYRLEDLLAGVTEENLHRETDTGEAVGREVW